jgi:hypothetical protein
MVPVSEDSRPGGRLEELHTEGLIVRYRHGDLKSLAEAGECALAMSSAERRLIFEHFNTRETVGAVVTEALARSVSQAHSPAILVRSDVRPSQSELLLNSA